jgi:hypothetical protein
VTSSTSSADFRVSAAGPSAGVAAFIVTPR